jgi:cell division protease FtsH
VPPGRALGVTVQSPVENRFNYSEEYLRSRIVGALGDRAELLVYETVTTGAENDLQQVTAIGREMVVRFGMSPKVGPLYFASEDGQAPLALQQKPFTEDTAALMDQEIKRIVDECLAEAQRLLAENRQRLDALAEALLREESLDEPEILRVTDLPAKPSSISTAAITAAR